MTARVIPQPGATVVYDVAAAGTAAFRTVTRVIGTVRDLGNGSYTCVLRDEAGGAFETVTIAPGANGGWVCAEPPVNIDGAIHTARRVLAGEVLHGSATAPLLTMARAVAHLTGAVRPDGPRIPARVERGRG